MLVITLTKKLGTTCSLLKRSKNLKSQQTQLGPDQNFFLMMIMLVFKVMKSSVTVSNKAVVSKDDESVVVLMVAFMMNKVFILKTTTVVLVLIFIYDAKILRTLKIMSLRFIFMTKMMNNDMIMMAALILNKVFNGEEK